jgi:hypothetical protein
MDSEVSSGRDIRSWFGGRLVISAALFLIIPILFIIAVAQLTKANGPQWMPDSFENPYNYLFNSLLAIKGQSPHSFQHPGTTTQVLGAMILRSSSTKSTNDLIISTLRDPEKQIRKLHWYLLIFTTLVLWIAPWMTAISLRSYLPALFIQASSLFYQTLLWYGIMFGPDLMLVPFSILAVCCCTLLVSPLLFPNRGQVFSAEGFGSAISNSTPKPRTSLVAVLTGIVCALGIVTKLTFFPFIFISLLCCGSRRNLISFTIAFVLGVIVALTPIYSQLPLLMTWMVNLGIHAGDYGSGPVGFPQLGEYVQDIVSLIEAEPLIAVIPIVTTIMILILSVGASESRQHRAAVCRIALPVAGLQLLTFLAIAKHPGVHYLIPLYLSTGLNLVSLFYVLKMTRASSIRRIAGWTALTGLLLLGFGCFVDLTPKNYIRQRQQAVNRLRLYKHAKELTKNDVRVDYFFSDSPIYPLCYGNDWAGGAFGPILLSLYPNQLFLNIFNDRFQTFTEWIMPEDILKKYDHLYFLGAPSYFPKIDGLDARTFETIDHADDYYLQKWTRKPAR